MVNYKNKKKHVVACLVLEELKVCSKEKLSCRICHTQGHVSYKYILLHVCMHMNRFCKWDILDRTTAISFILTVAIHYYRCAEIWAPGRCGAYYLRALSMEHDLCHPSGA